MIDLQAVWQLIEATHEGDESVLHHQIDLAIREKKSLSQQRLYSEDRIYKAVETDTSRLQKKVFMAK